MQCAYLVSTSADVMARDEARDRAAISGLVLRYAALVRDRNGGDCGNLFVDDAVYEIREIDPVQPDMESRLRNRLEGSAVIADYVRQSATGPVRVYPLIHNLLVELEDVGATASCLMTTRTLPPGNEVFGRYDDVFAFRNDRWLFASRTYTILDAPWMKVEMN